MIRFTLLLTALVALGCCVAVSALVAQPRDDADIYAFFGAPEGCAAPCFLGIRPGVTTEDQARALLSQHPWVAAVKTNPTGISWRWNGKQPAFVSSSFQATQIDVENGIVTRIRLATGIPFGNFAYVFGAPDRDVFTVNSSVTTYFIVRDAAYLKRGFEIETATSCPLKTRADLWYSILFITWSDQLSSVYDRMNSVKSC